MNDTRIKIGDNGTPGASVHIIVGGDGDGYVRPLCGHGDGHDRRDGDWTDVTCRSCLRVAESVRVSCEGCATLIAEHKRLCDECREREGRPWSRAHAIQAAIDLGNARVTGHAAAVIRGPNAQAGITMINALATRGIPIPGRDDPDFYTRTEDLDGDPDTRTPIERMIDALHDDWHDNFGALPEPVRAACIARTIIRLADRVAAEMRAGRGDGYTAMAAIARIRNLAAFGELDAPDDGGGATSRNFGRGDREDFHADG
jgi:hypothetical protein